MEPRREQEEAKYRSLREYSRVDGHLPIQISLVAQGGTCPGAVADVAGSRVAENQEMPEPQDRIIAECLRILNTKLGTPLSGCSRFQSGDYSSLRLERLIISAGPQYQDKESSCAVTWSKSFMLPTANYEIFYVYGKVVKSEPECDGNRFGSILP